MLHSCEQINQTNIFCSEKQTVYLVSLRAREVKGAEYEEITLKMSRYFPYRNIQLPPEFKFLSFTELRHFNTLHSNSAETK